MTTTIVKRPSTSVQNGVWTLVGGATVHGILSDNSDSSYLQSTSRAQLDSQFAVFDIADVVQPTDMPAGAKIEAVRLRIRTLQVAPSGGGSFGGGIIFFGQIVEAVVGGLLGGLFDFLGHLFHFPAPSPPTGGTPVFQEVQYAYYAEKPSGGAWDLATFNALTWKLGRSDTSGLTSKVSEFFVDLLYNEQPTVEIIEFPGDLVDFTTKPLFGIDYDDPDGDPQDAARFKVFTADQVAAVGFDVETSLPFTQADWILGSGQQWLCPRDLPNGDYVLYAQVRQKWTGPGDTPGSVGEFRSEWADYAFTVDVEGPDQPGLTATPNNAAKWMQLNATDGGGTYPAEAYAFYYSDNSGVDWSIVQGGALVTSDSSHNAVLFDYLGPLNKTRWYKVVAYRTLSGVKVASDESEIAMAMVNNREFWLCDPAAPSLNILLNLSDNKFTLDRAQGVSYPLVADGMVAYAKVVNGALQGEKGSIEAVFVDIDDYLWNRMIELWKPGRKLLWQHPTGRNVWIMIASKLDVGDWRTDGDTGVDYRIVSFDYYESESPQ